MTQPIDPSAAVFTGGTVDTHMILSPYKPDAWTDSIAETGTELRESSIHGVGDLGTQVTAYVTEDGSEFWLNWLDDSVNEWVRQPSEEALIAAYEKAVRETYPLLDPDTGTPTWTTSDVEGVPSQQD